MHVIDRIPMGGQAGSSEAPLAGEPRAHLYSVILDQVADAVAIIDPSGLYLEQNRAHAALIGYSDEELRGQTPALHLGQEAAREIMAALRAGGAYRGDVESRTKQGELKSLELSAFAVHDSQGRPLCYVGIKRDMTGRRRIEEALVGVRGVLDRERQEKAFQEAACAALEESERRQRFLLEQIPAVLWATDRQLRFTLSTGSGLKQLGLKSGQVVGLTLMECFQTEDPEALPIANVKRALAGEPVRFQQDWKGMTFETVVEPLYGTDGRIVGAIGLSQDITEHRRMQAALIESEEHLALAAEGSSLALWDGRCLPGKHWNDPDNPIWWSPKIREMLALESGEPFNTLGLWASRVHQEDLGFVMAALTAHAERRMPFDVEYRLRTNRGDYRWIRGRGLAMWDELGRPYRMAGSCLDLTEQKQAEGALRESEAQFRMMFDHAGIGMCRVDMAGRFLRTNRAFCELVGYSPEELATLRFKDLTFPDDLDRNLALFEQARMGKIGRYSLDKRYCRKDGRLVWASLVGSVGYDREGRPDYVLAQVQDITERKLAEHALRRSQDKLNQALQASNTGLWEWNTGTGEVTYSKEWKRQLGYEEGELADEFGTWESLLHPDDHQRATDYVRTYLANPASSYRQEFRLRHKDGSYRWIAACASFAVEADGHKIRLLGSHTDITERKRAEDALRESEERYRRLVDLSPSGIFVDCEGKTVYVNQAACRIMKVERPEDLLHRAAFEFIHPDSLGEVREHARALLKGGEPVRRAERKYVTLDGQVVDVLIEAGPIIWEGKPAILRIVSDITDRVQAQQAQRKHHALLSAIMDASIDLVSVKDPNGRYVHINQAGARALGRAIPEVIGQTDTQLWPADPAVSYRAADHRVLNTGELVTTEERATVNGTPAVYLTTRAPYRDSEGEIIGVIGVSRDITEWKRIEGALRSSEHRYRMLLDGLRDVVYLLSPEGVILSLNPAFEAHLGWDRDAWIGRPFLDLVHPDDRDGAVRGLTRALAGVKDTRTELRIRTKKVDWVMVEAAGGPYEEQGRVCGVLGVARDITARIKAERALSKTQADLRRITDAIPGFVYQYRVGPDGAQSFPFASRGTKELLGCEPAELEADARIGWSSVLPEDVSALQASIQVSAAELTPWTQEFRVRAADGQIKWLRGGSLPERQEDGATVWYGLFTDVTARREAEQQLRLTQFAMDHAADAIIWAGPDRRLVYANEEACRSLAYSKREILQLSLSDIAPQYDPVRFEQRVALLKQGQTVQYQSFHRAKDGREFPVEVSIRYLEHNGIGYTCGIARDITERKELERQLRHSDRLATLGTITAGVAHELNNPLFVISGHLHLIERKLVRRQLKALRKELTAAQDAAERATTIVSRFLNTAHGSVDVREPCEVAEIMEQTLVLMRNEFRVRHIHVERHMPSAMPSVSADPQALTQVFLNLLTNACQALEADSGAGLISIELRATDLQGSAWVECLIRDNGPGIPPDLLPRIFDPFFTTKPVGEGTGLGLAICHRIVSELCGTLTCESRLGEGATFTVRLPATGSSAPFQPLRRSTRRRKG